MKSWFNHTFEILSTNNFENLSEVTDWNTFSKTTETV